VGSTAYQSVIKLSIEVAQLKRTIEDAMAVLGKEGVR
jgi:hypothetical protein